MGMNPLEPSLESGLYVPRVTDWNLKKTNLMPEILKKSKQKLKKPVSRMFLKLRLSVHRTVTDLQADSRAGGSHGGLPFSRNFCRNDQICLEFLNNATYYTLSVTSWTRRRPQPLFPRGKKGEEIEVLANVVEHNFKNLNPPVSNELIVKRNEPPERHLH